MTCCHTVACNNQCQCGFHYSNVIMSEMASHITILAIVCSIVNSGVDQRKHQSSASLAFVWGIRRWPRSSPHKWPVTRNMYPFDDVIMINDVVLWHSLAHKRTFPREIVNISVTIMCFEITHLYFQLYLPRVTELTLYKNLHHRPETASQRH